MMNASPRQRQCGRFRACPPRREQGGMVLLIVLVVLGLMFLAGIGVMRASDTSNVIAGNYSFQQAAIQASDRAVTDAMNDLSGLVTGGGGNTSVADQYLATQQTNLDANGIPTDIDWDDVACVDPSGTAIADCSADTGDYRVQYVIERMCSSNPTMTDLNDIRAKCEYEPTSAAATAASEIAIRYRILMRVRGPRGTDGYFEAMVSGPASTI
jgi:type IV pilus assembly protein PilX